MFIATHFVERNLKETISHDIPTVAVTLSCMSAFSVHYILLVRTVRLQIV